MRPNPPAQVRHAHAFRRSLARTAGAALAAAALAVAPATAAVADSNPYRRGPDPTLASVTTTQGPFDVAHVTVPAGTASGFNDGIIYYPTDRSQGTFGAIVVMPGFVSPEGSIDWYGPMLASQGFVVMTLDSQSPFDFPAARSQQQLAALDYLVGKSQVKDRIDPNRTAVMGWSMGGGGSLQSANNRPALKADIALAPWDIGSVTPSIKVPTMILTDDSDILAPDGLFGKPFYQGLSAEPDKYYLELKNATHFTFTSANTTIERFTISWMKRFVDKDTRYDQFLCPVPAPDSAIAAADGSCPIPG